MINKVHYLDGPGLFSWPAFSVKEGGRSSHDAAGEGPLCCVARVWGRPQSGRGAREWGWNICFRGQGLVSASQDPDQHLCVELSGIPSVSFTKLLPN